LTPERSDTKRNSGVTRLELHLSVYEIRLEDAVAFLLSVNCVSCKREEGSVYRNVLHLWAESGFHVKGVRESGSGEDIGV